MERNATLVENFKSRNYTDAHINLPVVVKPRRVTGYYDVMGLLRDTVFSF